MNTYIRQIRLILMALIQCVLFTGCLKWEAPSSSSDSLPPVFPDYTGVTVPSNIAPLNFMVEDAEKIQAVFSLEGRELAKEIGKKGILSVDPEDWRSILDQAAGRSFDVTVSVWNDQNRDGLEYQPFRINVAADEIDGWIAYRLIEPGYEGWRQLGLYQRELSSFAEIAIVTNSKSTTTCVNCHHFPAYSSESMMFHARGANGGTILYHNGSLAKIDFKSIGLKKNTTYPAWHPGGRFIAFSANTTHQIFYGEGRQQIEVFDTASDLILYDTETGDALTDPRFSTEKELETFPSWSPDGKYLYFVSHRADSLPVRFTPDMQYDLLRVPFDHNTRTFGAKIDTLYRSSVQGGSVSYPRVSADGRYLLYTLSDYGTFPIWHTEADLRMMNLETMQPVNVSEWNDAEEADSYHSWSSDGRWVIFGSRRLDGRFTRLYIGYFDEEGRPHKPFLLPQEDPRYHLWRHKSFNVPEFIDSRVELPDEAEKMFLQED